MTFTNKHYILSKLTRYRFTYEYPENGWWALPRGTDIPPEVRKWNALQKPQRRAMSSVTHFPLSLLAIEKRTSLWGFLAVLSAEIARRSYIWLPLHLTHTKGRMKKVCHLWRRKIPLQSSKDSAQLLTYRRKWTHSLHFFHQVSSQKCHINKIFHG